MRRLTVLVVTLGVLWSAWWWVAATVAERGVRAALSGVQGIEAEVADISVLGFPNRVDMTLTAPRVVSADGWGWEAEFLQLFALTYRPWHVIAAFAPVQRIATPLAPAVLAFDKGQASVVLVPGPDLAFDRFVLDLASPALSIEGIGETRAARALVALRAAEGVPARYELDFEITEAAADPHLVAALPEQSALPHHLQTVRLELAVDLDAPLDRHAGARPPRPVAVDLRAAEIVWGDVRFLAEGRLGVDAAGFLEGEIRLDVRDWPRALAVAETAGWIAPNAARTWERILTFFSNPKETGRFVQPLVLADGQMSLGAIRLGMAPRIADFLP
jgi:hypothetical protein